MSIFGYLVAISFLTTFYLLYGTVSAWWQMFKWFQAEVAFIMHLSTAAANVYVFTVLY